MTRSKKKNSKSFKTLILIVFNVTVTKICNFSWLVFNGHSHGHGNLGVWKTGHGHGFPKKVQKPDLTWLSNTNCSNSHMYGCCHWHWNLSVAHQLRPERTLADVGRWKASVIQQVLHTWRVPELSIGGKDPACPGNCECYQESKKLVSPSLHPSVLLSPAQSQFQAPCPSSRFLPMSQRWFFLTW